MFGWSKRLCTEPIIIDWENLIFVTAGMTIQSIMLILVLRRVIVRGRQLCSTMPIMIPVASGYCSSENTTFWLEQRCLDNLARGTRSCSNTNMLPEGALHWHSDSTVVINYSQAQCMVICRRLFFLLRWSLRSIVDDTKGLLADEASLEATTQSVVQVGVGVCCCRASRTRACEKQDMISLGFHSGFSLETWKFS